MRTESDTELKYDVIANKVQEILCQELEINLVFCIHYC